MQDEFTAPTLDELGISEIVRDGEADGREAEEISVAASFQPQSQL